MECKDCGATLPVRLKARGRPTVRCAECQKCHRQATDSASKRARYAKDPGYKERERQRARQAYRHRAGFLFFHATQ